VALAGLLAFGVPFLLSLGLAALLRPLALRLGFVDDPGGRKVHPGPIPLGGGVAIALALSAAFGLAWALGALPPSVAAGIALRSPALPWILAGALAVFAAGLWDDLKDLGPWSKLAVQLLAAATVAIRVPEARITVLGAGSFLQIALTVVWIIAITNAFNFMDNMDGLATGVAAVASLLLAAIAFLTGRDLMAVFFLALLGGLAGFLVFNLPPASLFLGDAGSLLVGFLLGVGTVLFTYDEAPRSLAPLGVPLLVFGVPLFDLVTVMAIRLKEGRPLAAGDRSHFSHRLVALGMSPREAVGSICLLTFVIGMGALLLYHVPQEAVPLLIGQAVGAFAIIALLERAARRRP
jgi:UDP-GlcNAc:undecaprenyl-phosphate GlcNAc-1-phosphate transferase